MVPNLRYANCCVFSRILCKLLTLSKLSTSVLSVADAPDRIKGSFLSVCSFDFAGLRRVSHKAASSKTAVLSPAFCT
jgi:hypothetical protein